MVAPNKIERLLDDLCSELGFCLARKEREYLSANPPDSASAFANAVFAAEGLNPELADRHLWRQIRDRIADCIVGSSRGS